MMEQEQRRPIVKIVVYNHKGKLLSNAKVTIKPLREAVDTDRTGTISMRFDNTAKVYQADNVDPGLYILRAESEGYEAQDRAIAIGQNGLSDTFILGNKGMTYVYRGKIKVPFDPPKDLLAVSIKPRLKDRRHQQGGGSGGEEEALLAYANQLGLQVEEVGEQILKENVRIFRFPSNAREEDKKQIQARLAESPYVRIVGPVIHLNKKGVTFLTNQLIVKFNPNITKEEVQSITHQFNMKIIRNIPYAENTFLLSSNEEANYEILNTNDKIVNTGVVEYAEPNLVITKVDDDSVVTPTDYLYKLDKDIKGHQWHIDFINLPQAWGALRDYYKSTKPFANLGEPGDITFGSENIIIAVMDTGIESVHLAQHTFAKHPDFDGNVTSGEYKVYKFFNFMNMKPSNSPLPYLHDPQDPNVNPEKIPYPHGTACTGIASALANNPSGVMGESEGVVGAAPNCRLMSLIRPIGGTEIQYADAYMWAAGFDPGWVIDNWNYTRDTDFPPVIHPGADIITSSFGDSDTIEGLSVPISNLMKECFDYLTNYGRPKYNLGGLTGRGVLLFFSAGNDNVEFQLERPWAAYEKTIAVAASTIEDIKDEYSNFADGIHVIDICAPCSTCEANDVNCHDLGLTTCWLVGKGDWVGHAAQAGKIPSKDYYHLGGTSAATPLVAGVAALILSVKPDLKWYEARDILRSSAIKIDANNTDAVGMWTDILGRTPRDLGYLDPHYSRWYGYGRIDALKAVQKAIGITFSSFNLRPGPDLSKWEAVFILIWGGAIYGGSGTGITPGRRPVPIDPGPGPLPKDKQDILVGLAVTELASIINNSEARLGIEKAGVEAMSKAVEKLKESLASKSLT